MSDDDMIKRGHALDALSVDMNEAFTDIAAVPAIKVKQLVWEDYPIRPYHCRAKTFFHEYTIGDSGSGEFVLTASYGWFVAETMEDAKIQAQADYERLILSALE